MSWFIIVIGYTGSPSTLCNVYYNCRPLNVEANLVVRTLAIYPHATA